MALVSRRKLGEKMYPDNSQSPVILNTTPQGNKKRTLLIALLVVGIVLLSIVSLFIKKNATPQQGTVTIVYGSLAIGDLKISFDGKEQTMKLSPATYKLTPGEHKLEMTASGYKNFTATVPVTVGQTVQVNAQLKPASTTPVTNSSQIVLPEEVSNLQILDTEYYYNNSWAILHVNTSDDTNAVLILQLDVATGKWHTVVGPALAVDPVTTANLPALIQQYLNDNYLVVDGD
jgi:hypothetical protein